MLPRVAINTTLTPLEASPSLTTSTTEIRVSSSREVEVPLVHLVLFLVHLVQVLALVV